MNVHYVQKAGGGGGGLGWEGFFLGGKGYFLEFSLATNSKNIAAKEVNTEVV